MGVTYWIIDGLYVRLVYTMKNRNEGVEILFNTTDIEAIYKRDALYHGIDKTVFFL